MKDIPDIDWKDIRIGNEAIVLINVIGQVQIVNKSETSNFVEPYKKRVCIIINDTTSKTPLIVQQWIPYEDQTELVEETQTIDLSLLNKTIQQWREIKSFLEDDNKDDSTQEMDDESNSFETNESIELDGNSEKKKDIEISSVNYITTNILE